MTAAEAIERQARGDAPETLRDRCAMAALTGILACGYGTEHKDETMAAWAYRVADAMLAASKAVQP